MIDAGRTFLIISRLDMRAGENRDRPVLEILRVFVRYVYC